MDLHIGCPGQLHWGLEGPDTGCLRNKGRALLDQAIHRTRSAAQSANKLRPQPRSGKGCWHCGERYREGHIGVPRCPEAVSGGVAGSLQLRSSWLDGVQCRVLAEAEVKVEGKTGYARGSCCVGLLREEFL